MKVINNPISRYLQSSFSELKKVNWLSRKEITSLTIMVIISVAVATFIVMGIDYLLTKFINLIIQQ